MAKRMVPAAALTSEVRGQAGTDGPINTSPIVNDTLQSDGTALTVPQENDVVFSRYTGEDQKFRNEFWLPWGGCHAPDRVGVPGVIERMVFNWLNTVKPTHEFQTRRVAFSLNTGASGTLAESVPGKTTGSHYVYWELQQEVHHE